MTIESEINSHLSAFVGLTALIGTDPVRFYAKKAPEGVDRPYVVYQLVTETREHCMGVTLVNVNSLWRFNAWADTNYTAGTLIGSRQVGEQLRQALNRWRLPAGGVVIEDTFIENISDLYDNATDRDGRSVLARIHYKE